eukprot:3012207-Pyramimonas_sp.AAC.1
MACFAGAKSDLKARRESNFFTRSWQRTLICDRCGAQNVNHVKSDPTMWFTNFNDNAPHRDTMVKHHEYMAEVSARPGAASPLSQIPGWRIELN